MTETNFRAALRSGATMLGAFVMTDGVFNAESMAHAGFDYVCVDRQHGLMSSAQTLQMLQAISGTPAIPIVRTADANPSSIERALDAGAQGVIVPMVETAEQAEQIVASCRYAPTGRRSYGPTRAGLFLGNDVATASEVACFVMIETDKGLENVEQICAVPGLDGVYVGPSDLALTLGSPLAPKSPAVYEAIDTIRRACEAAGITPGIHGGSGTNSAKFLADGFRLVTVTQDYSLIALQSRAELETAGGTTRPF
jgi:4-hydroxy-2-oxoheptanedioate aldolase